MLTIATSKAVPLRRMSAGHLHFFFSTPRTLMQRVYMVCTLACRQTLRTRPYATCRGANQYSAFLNNFYFRRRLPVCGPAPRRCQQVHIKSYAMQCSVGGSVGGRLSRNRPDKLQTAERFQAAGGGGRAVVSAR